MIPRYSTPEMTAVWSDVSKFGQWLEVELLATEAHAAIGVVPAGDAVACRTNAPDADAALVEAILERERVTDHDVAAFVDVVQGAIAVGGSSDAGKWIHYGLTSSDVGDTALC
ncbi:MAG: adenylosuccinate lyase, partial [Ilumatobacter sp.]